MAGHSQFKNIMHRKGAQDAKRAKMFTKIVREIYVAAKQNPDINFNPKLRLAIENARDANMPKDRVDAAIKKATDSGASENYDEIRYEGYGPGGVAIIVEALTDNRNRTASDVRAAFNKYGGQLGETGSVGFMFDRIGQILYGPEINADEILEAAIEAGADDSISTDEGHEIVTSVENFHKVKEHLEAKFGQSLAQAIIWKPHNTNKVEGEQAEKLTKMIDALEDSDDVQNVYGNFEF